MNYVVAVPVDKSLAEFIGKKSSENGIAFYNRKVDDHVVVALAPTNPQEKFYGFVETMLLADQIVISTASVDRLLGEALITAELLGKHLIITEENDVKALLAGTGIKDFEFSSREQLLEKILAYRKPAEPAGVRIDIDQAFPVKGIGSVALGIVTRGTVKVHDKLIHNSGKEVEIKSIQSQDVDQKEAGMGTRVGIALKGIESDEMDKGDILCHTRIPKVKSITLSAKRSTFVGEELKEGGRYMIAANFSHSIAFLDDPKTMRFTLEKPIAIEKGQRVTVSREQQPRVFASGTVTEATA